MEEKTTVKKSTTHFSMTKVKSCLDPFGKVTSGALFDEDKKYRYMLYREWDSTKPAVGFVGLNPSKANEVKDDPTITKVCKIAHHNGYGSVYMFNLFAIVGEDPEIINQVADPLKDNDYWIKSYMQNCRALVCCWGNFKQAVGRDAIVKHFLFPDKFYHYLKINKNGSPKHPLYCKDNSKIHLHVPHYHE